MARIVDLDVIVPEPVQFKIGGEVYEIPGSPTTEFLIKFMSLDMKVLNQKDDKKKLELMAEMSAMLLNQDPNHEVTKEFCLKNLSFVQMKAIGEIFKETVTNIELNPNS